MREIKINSTTGNEIVTTQEAKDYLRVENSADDNIIARMIIQARIWCENYISSDIVAKNRTYYVKELKQGQYYYDEYETPRLQLPFGPVASISSVTTDGNTSTYEIKGINNEIIELKDGSAKEIKVTYITQGLADSLVKQAILQTVSTYYDNRADFKTGTIVSEIPTGAKDILAVYKNPFV